MVLVAKPSNAAFRALADPTRREILRALANGSKTSGEIAGLFESSWPTISRHLAVLRDSGLVLAKRSGQEIHYELNTSVFQDLLHHLMDWIPAERTPRLRSRRARRHQEA
jgi:DNA-binding transcriptional ArsR family regulator